MKSFIWGQLAVTIIEERISTDAEAKASAFLENREEMFPCIVMSLIN